MGQNRFHRFNLFEDPRRDVQQVLDEDHGEVHGVGHHIFAQAQPNLKRQLAEETQVRPAGLLFDLGNLGGCPIGLLGGLKP